MFSSGQKNSGAAQEFKGRGRSRSRGRAAPPPPPAKRQQQAQGTPRGPQNQAPQNPGYNQTAVIKQGSVQVNIVRGMTSSVPPVVFQRMLGAWPVTRQGSGDAMIMEAIVDPMAVGYNDWSKFDVVVGNTTAGSDVHVQFFDDDGNVGYEATITSSNLPKPLTMTGYSSVRVSAVSGQLVVYFNVVGTIKKYTLCEDAAPDMDVGSPAPAGRSVSVGRSR
jgi:hypothetical protein